LAVEVGGIRQFVQLLQKGLVGVEAKTGKFLWRFGKPVSRFNANIPTPVFGDGVAYAGSAGTGGGAVKLQTKDGGVVAEPLYFEASLPSAIGGAVKVGDDLYGTTGSALLCIEFQTGQVKWKERALGAASICCADGRLYLHGETARRPWSSLRRKAIASRAVSRRRIRLSAPTIWRKHGRTRWLPGEGFTFGITVACGAMTSKPGRATTENRNWGTNGHPGCDAARCP
jgi:hypothetical protein